MYFTAIIASAALAAHLASAAPASTSSNASKSLQTRQQIPRLTALVHCSQQRPTPSGCHKQSSRYITIPQVDNDGGNDIDLKYDGNRSDWIDCAKKCAQRNEYSGLGYCLGASSGTIITAG